MCSINCFVALGRYIPSISDLKELLAERDKVYHAYFLLSNGDVEETFQY